MTWTQPEMVFKKTWYWIGMHRFKRGELWKLLSTSMYADPLPFLEWNVIIVNYIIVHQLAILPIIKYPSILQFLKEQNVGFLRKPRSLYSVILDLKNSSGDWNYKHNFMSDKDLSKTYVDYRYSSSYPHEAMRMTASGHLPTAGQVHDCTVGGSITDICLQLARYMIVIRQ